MTKRTIIEQTDHGATIEVVGDDVMDRIRDQLNLIEVNDPERIYVEIGTVEHATSDPSVDSSGEVTQTTPDDGKPPGEAYTLSPEQREGMVGREYKFLDDEDRADEPGDPNEGTMRYKALELLAELGAMSPDDAVTAKELLREYADRYPDERESSLSPQMSQMYVDWLVERQRRNADGGGIEFEYWISEYGLGAIAGGGDDE